MIRWLLKRALGPVKRFVETHVFQTTRVLVMAADPERIPAVEAKVPVFFQPVTDEHSIWLTAGSEHHLNRDLASDWTNNRKWTDVYIGTSLDGTLLFSGWLLHGRMDLHRGNLVPLAPTTAFSYRIVTSASTRGSRICPAYYSYLRGHLLQRGIRSLVCLIATSNGSSIRAHSSAGFRPVGMFWLIRLGGKMVTHVPARLRRQLSQAAELS